MAPVTRGARRQLPVTGEPVTSIGSAQKGIFRKEGEYWTIGCSGKPFRLKDTRGLGYIAHLLRNPAIEFHVLDLVGGIAGQHDEDEPSKSANGLPRGEEDLEKAGIHISGLGDAGEMLDDQAKTAYRRRLSELREDLDQAKTNGNVERAERAEQEIEALTKELSRAVGLGGRNRRAASASERARQTITHSIKSVLYRIGQSDSALADLFSRAIKTGTFCSYQPDPDFPVAWQFAETITESAERPKPIAVVAPAASRADLPPAPAAVLEVSPFSFAERTAFVGREAELGAIRSLIDRALDGQGSIVMVAGGPGLGKSRLTMAMADYATRVGFRCLVGHCYERDEPFPYLPFAEILESALAQAASPDDFRRRMGDNAAALAQIAPSLRRAIPDIPPPMELPPAQQRRYLLQSISEAVAVGAQTRSYVYILEDLHWAHESTLALLVHLANRVSQIPVIIIGTYRDGYSETNPALTRTLEELIRLGIRPLKLNGLSKDNVAQILYQLSGREVPESLTNLVFEESQGNPFFVEELYRHLVEEGKVFDEAGEFRTDITIDETDVPENVRLIVGRRLERFDENEKRVLAAAAVIGRSFSFQLLAAICQIDVDDLFTAIEKAQRMGVIVASAEGPERPYTFNHELVRQTLLAGISAPRQQRLHADVADAIERLYPDDGGRSAHAGDVADHLLKAGSFTDDRRLVHCLTLAGKGALQAAAFEEARRSFESALSHLGNDAVTERADLICGIAYAERGLERWDVAFAKLEEALEMYIALGDRKMIARSCAELTSLLVWAGHFQKAMDTARRGLTYLEGDVTNDRAHVLAGLAQTHASAGDYGQAHAAMEEAMNIASKRSDLNLTARLYGSRSVVNYQFLRFREVIADAEKSQISEFRPWESAVQLLVLEQSLLHLGRLDEAARVRDELEPFASKIGQSYTIARCLLTRGWVEFGQQSDLVKLETVVHRVFKTEPRVPFGFWDVFAGAQLSLVDFLRGNWADALQNAEASCQLELGTSTRGLGVGTLFRHLAYAGDRVLALALLDEKRGWLPVSGMPNPLGAWPMLAFAIEGLAILGERGKAGELYPLARELVETGTIVLWPIFRFSQTVAGIAAASARNWDAAEEHFKTALQQAESLPLLLEQAEIRRFRAMMLLNRAARGDREKARGLLEEAREIYTQIGMPRHVEMIQTLIS